MAGAVASDMECELFYLEGAVQSQPPGVFTLQGY